MAVYLFGAAVVCLLLSLAAPAAEVLTITRENAAEVAPSGKEADWIYGDHVLRNNRIVAVIGRPVATRNANMTVRGVGGCLIDLTSRARPNDQLSCYYPAGGQAAFRSVVVAAGSLVTEAAAGKPLVVTGYEIADDADFLIVNDAAGPAVGVVVVLRDAHGERYGAGRTDADGRLGFAVPSGAKCGTCSATDGTPDAGFEPMLGFVDVLEVHPRRCLSTAVPSPP